ncbi:MAG: hypothetical protein WC856_08275 [Methylococcaceae bacterium]
MGDVWLKKYHGDKVGSSLFEANSEKSRMIIENVARNGKIYLENEKADNIVVSLGTNHI